MSRISENNQSLRFLTFLGGGKKNYFSFFVVLPAQYPAYTSLGSSFFSCLFQLEQFILKILNILKILFRCLPSALLHVVHLKYK